MDKKELARDIFDASLKAVMPQNFIPNNLFFDGKTLMIKDTKIDLTNYKDIYIFGSGKASIKMAKATKSIIGDCAKKVVVISNYSEDVDGIEVIKSSHPLPSIKSIKAGERFIEEFESMGEDDFFIYLLSGGSSALIEKLIDGVSLDDFILVTDLMLKNSLSIDEINIVRKSLSQIKGGGLASKTKARGVVLVISDVIGDNLNDIGSAPLLKGEFSLSRAKEILEKYNIFDKIPDNIQDILSDLKDRKIEAKEFEHFILASNRVALKAGESRARELGLSTKIVTDLLMGDVKSVAEFIVSEVQKCDKEVLLFGGESTVQIRGNGNGGRNQELTLWVLKKMSKNADFTFLSAGSDGIDGNSDAAGGVVDLSDLNDDIDSFLKNNDSYHYLKKQDALIITGESGTNVMDIMIAIKG